MVMVVAGREVFFPAGFSQVVDLLTQGICIKYNTPVININYNVLEVFCACACNRFPRVKGLTAEGCIGRNRPQRWVVSMLALV